ncbi:MAG: lysophospholipid acyltransferase family protein, partial [Gemmatimonadota bacterium]|nr:lysophospholipid acyltransferase family protein [Gemmatimonadota bacterium]
MAARVLLVGGWTVVVVVSLLCVYLLAMARPGSVQAVRARARRRAMRIWGRGMMRAVGVRVSVEGVPPPPGALVVSNHLSYLDIPVLGSVMPMVFVAMAELRRWPFWGFAASMGDTIFVDRATRRDVIRVRDEMAQARERGDTVIVFPRGDGARVRGGRGAGGHVRARRRRRCGAPPLGLEPRGARGGRPGGPRHRQPRRRVRARPRA